MTTGYQMFDPILGTKDLSDEFITDEWLVDKYVGNTLWACGYNNYGQLGNGTNTNYSSPIQIGSLTTWKQVTAGDWNFGAIKTDSTLWTCGYNAGGQLGNGTTTSYNSPIQVGTPNSWKQVVCSQLVTHAIQTNGTLWSWGGNATGQIGNGASTSVSYSSPVQVGSSTNWKQVAVFAAGISSVWNGLTAAIQTNGTLWVWGSNTYGQVGNGTSGNKFSSPIQVGLLTNWKYVSVGVYHIAAIKTDGTLWAWGNGYYGGLGLGNSTSYSSPIQVGTLTNWKYVACGYNATYGVKSDGTLWSWGLNNTGQLGNGTTTAYSSPIQVGTSTNWKYISSSTGLNIMTLGSAGYVMAIKTDGTLWGWGNNYFGSLGNGITTNYSSPIQVGTLTNWKQVVAGWPTLGITYTEIPT